MNILLIQANATTPSAPDQACEDWLEARYGASGSISTGTITTRDDSLAAPSFTGIDLIVLAPNASHTDVASKYDNAAPAVVLSGTCWRQGVMELQIGTNSTNSSVTQIRVANSGDPLAGGLGVGLHTVFTATQTVARLSSGGDLPSGATHVIEPSSIAAPVVWGIDVGELLGNGATASYRQVAWGIARDGFTNANATFNTLLEAAITWAANIPTGQVANAATVTENAGAYTDHLGSSVNADLLTALDSPRADAAYVQSPENPSNATMKVTLDTITSAAGDELKYTYGKTGTAQLNQTVQLRSPDGSTLIEEWVHTDVGAFPQLATQDVSAHTLSGAHQVWFISDAP